MHKTGLLLLLVLSASGCVTVNQGNPGQVSNIRTGGFNDQVQEYGYIQDMRRVTVQKQGQASAAGAVVGGITGAAIGNQIGKGNGKKLSTVAGAVAGAAVGNAIAEQNARVNVPGVEIVVRLRNNDLVTITQELANDNFYIGQAVKVVYRQNIAFVAPI